jgi:hypothetical protein
MPHASLPVERPDYRSRYLGLLNERLASSEKFLSEIILLADEWDSEMEHGSDGPSLQRAEDRGLEVCDSRVLALGDSALIGRCDDFRPLLVVDEAELKQEIVALRRQIAMLDMHPDFAR